MKVRLFTTEGCHLCDEALVQLETLIAAGRPMDIEQVDIAESDALMETYGIRIPVIAIPARKDDIGWPFTPEEIEAFLDHE